MLPGSPTYAHAGGNRTKPPELALQSDLDAAIAAAANALSSSQATQDTTISQKLDASTFTNVNWTFVKLSSDFSTSSLTPVDVTGLLMTPQASTDYEFAGRFFLRTSTVLIGPQIGVTWPTGMTDGVVEFRVGATATAVALGNGNISGEATSSVLALSTTSGSWPGRLEGFLRAGGSPGGNLQVRLTASGVGTVTIKAGSWLAYRKVA